MTGYTGFVPIAADKSHARIIWDCAWAHEGDVFATASRDKTVRAVVYIMTEVIDSSSQVRIWRLKDKDTGEKWLAAASLKTKEAATAIAFAAADLDG